MEDEPRQRGDLDVIRLGGERLGLLEGAGPDHHVLELRAKTCDQRIRQPALEPKHKVGSDIAHAVVDAVEAQHFLNGLPYRVGYLVKRQVRRRNEVASE